MQSQRKMLSSGTAASSRSASVRSAGRGLTVATLILGLVPGALVDSGAEDDAGIEVGLAPDEPARHLCERAGVNDEAEPLTRCVRNRHEDGGGPHAREDLLDLCEPAQDGSPLQPPPR